MARASHVAANADGSLWRDANGARFTSVCRWVRGDAGRGWDHRSAVWIG